MFVRNTGKLCFATLQSGDGTQLQAMLSLDRVGEPALADWKADVDLGDIVAVEGEVVTSRRGELSVLADTWQLAAKALRPLPVAHKELAEETRVRQRYADLIVRPLAREVARTRIRTVASLRESFADRGYLEVETPMLQTLTGGASARPFVTHMNAYDLELYLRIAPELFLKRCLVGGIERVFEINRNFRNEGADSTHSPEFVMLEYYQAYADYDTMATLTRELIQEAAERVYGSQQVTHADGPCTTCPASWDVGEHVRRGVGGRRPRDQPEDPAQRAAAAGGSGRDRGGPGVGARESTSRSCSSTTSHRGSPARRSYATSPRTPPRWSRATARCPASWRSGTSTSTGSSCATGYSELNDPVVQRERLVEQARLGAKGDAEAMHLDEDFLRALEYGMPPAGGVGLGIDRLLMALTGLGIRETVLFPLVKPE